MQKITRADVVITGSSKLAIALKYDIGYSGAPVVLAKGAHLLARHIKKQATEHNVPIHEDKSVAHFLYKHGKVGQEIPNELFQAVAEVLAYVFQLRHRQN